MVSVGLNDLDPRITKLLIEQDRFKIALNVSLDDLFVLQTDSIRQTVLEACIYLFNNPLGLPLQFLALYLDILSKQSERTMMCNEAQWVCHFSHFPTQRD